MSAQGSCILFCRSLLETHPDLKKHGQAVTLVTSCLEPFDKYLAR